MKWLGLVSFTLLVACGGDRTSNRRGVYMLVDTSGTYAQEVTKAVQIISVILTRLEPGDSFAVASIDTASFSEKDIVAKVTFSDRPSLANQQKRQFRQTIDRFVEESSSAAYTDITGAVLQAVEYLNEKDPSTKSILIFSDLQEDLQQGLVRDIPLQLSGFDVVAVNVTKLRSDNVDPREYLDRLAVWQQRVQSGGGSWRVINDLDQLERLLP